MAFLGGLGTVGGPVLGALIIEPAYLTFQQQASYLYWIAYGALFLVIILLLPRGIIPTAAEQISKWRARGRGSREHAAAAPAAVPDRAEDLA